MGSSMKLLSQSVAAVKKIIEIENKTATNVMTFSKFIVRSHLEYCV